jgi:hypothetical protein
VSFFTSIASLLIKRYLKTKGINWFLVSQFGLDHVANNPVGIVLPCTRFCKNLHALKRHSTENSKQIFLEMNLRGLAPDFHIHVSVWNLYIPTIGPPIFAAETRRIDRS